MKNFAAFWALAMITVISGCNTGSNGNGNANTNTNTARNENAHAPANANANANVSKKGTREEYEKNKQSYSQEAKELGRKIGAGVDDGWLWTKTRFELAAASDLRDSTINVDVDNAVVTLTGSVPTAAQKSKAESIVKSVSGVKGVKNLLKVAPANTNNNAKSNTNSKSTKY